MNISILSNPNLVEFRKIITDIISPNF